VAGFDDEVRDDFVEGADGFGERRGLVAEGVESGFYCLEVLDSGGAGCWGRRGEGKGESRSVWKFSWPLWRAARARGSVILLRRLGDGPSSSSSETERRR